MKHSALIVAIVSALAAGCASSDLTTTTTALVSQRMQLVEPGYTDVTSEIVRIDVSYGTKTSWTALYGPNPNSATPVSVQLLGGGGAKPLVNVTDGWVYLVGAWPMAETDRISAGATGTRMIVQHDQTGGVAAHRVILMGKDDVLQRDAVDVKLKDLAATDDTEKQIFKVEYYIEVDDAATKLPDPTGLGGAPTNVKTLVDHIRTVKSLAGLK